MLFNSLEFALFFIIVYSLYLLLSHKWQNRLLLVASYIFYGAWDWRFLSLIFVSTLLDYYCGLKIHDSKDARRKKLFLWFSLAGNLSLLGFFKYFNFFAGSLQSLLEYFGFVVHPHFLHIILPVGISFYTFQTMSYTIDVYRKELEPTKSFLNFALFVSFFPQLVAGPIERAKHLLPQVLSPRTLSLRECYEGSYLVFWGLFQKAVVADNLGAQIVDPIFNSAPPYNGIEVLLAVYAFAFQIYCDFAGYSNMARGLGKLMGFDLMVNFNLPYFATNPREFWQRWHISLSSWLRDYLYIPLGGNRAGSFNTYRNLVITMLLGGLWHGANWTFVIWGAYHGMLIVLHRFLKPVFEIAHLPKGGVIERIGFFVKVICFFHLVCLGWLIFRAQTMTQVAQMMEALGSNFYISLPVTLLKFQDFMILVWLLVTVQIVQYYKNDSLIILKSRIWIRASFYLFCYLLLIVYGVWHHKEFIYFQF